MSGERAASIMEAWDNRDLTSIVLRHEHILRNQLNSDELVFLHSELESIKDLRENAVLKNEPETITGEWSFTSSPVIPNATSPGHPVTLSQLNTSIDDFITPSDNATITGTWSFNHAPTIPQATASTHPVRYDQLDSVLDDYIKPTDDVAISGSWAFNKPLTVGTPTNNNHAAKYSQIVSLINDLADKLDMTTDEPQGVDSPVTFAGHVSFTETVSLPTGVTLDSATFTGNTPTYNDSTLLTSAAWQSERYNFDQIPSYTGTSQSPVTENKNFTTKKYVDDLVESKELHRDDLAYLADANLFEDINTFEELPRIRTDSLILPDPRTYTIGDKIYSDFVHHSYFIKENVSKTDGGTFTGDVNFAGDLKYKGSKIDTLYINKNYTTSQSLSGELNAPGFNVNGTPVALSNAVLKLNNTADVTTVNGLVNFQDGLRVAGSNVSTITLAEVLILEALGLAAEKTIFTVFGDSLVSKSAVRTVGDKPTSLNYAYCDKTMNYSLTNDGFSGSFGSGAYRPRNASYRHFLPFFYKIYDHGDTAYDIATIGCYSGNAPFVPYRYVEGLRVSCDGNKVTTQPDNFDITIGHNTIEFPESLDDTLEIKPIHYSTSYKNNLNFQRYEENYLIGKEKSLYWYIANNVEHSKDNWHYSHSLLKGNIVPNSLLNPGANYGYQPIAAFRDFDLSLGEVELYYQPVPNTIDEHYYYKALEHNHKRNNYNITDNDRQIAESSSYGRGFWLSQRDSIMPVMDAKIDSYGVSNNFDGIRVENDDKLELTFQNSSVLNRNEYELPADDFHNDWPHTVTYGAYSRTKLYHLEEKKEIDPKHYAYIDLYNTIGFVNVISQDDFYTYKTLESSFNEEHICDFNSTYNQFKDEVYLSHANFRRQSRVGEQSLFEDYSAYHSILNPTLSIYKNIKIGLGNYKVRNKNPWHWIFIEGTPTQHNKEYNPGQGIHLFREPHANQSNEDSEGYSILNLFENYTERIPEPFKLSLDIDTGEYELSIFKSPCTSNKPLIYAYANGNKNVQCSDKPSRVEINGIVNVKKGSSEQIEIYPELAKTHNVIVKVPSDTENQYNITTKKTQAEEMELYNSMVAMDPTYMGPVKVTDEGSTTQKPAFSLFKKHDDEYEHMALFRPENGRPSMFTTALKVLGKSITSVISPLSTVFGVFKATTNDDAYLIRGACDTQFTIKNNEEWKIVEPGSENTDNTLFHIYSSTSENKPARYKTKESNLLENSVNEIGSVQFLINEKQDEYNPDLGNKAATQNFVKNEMNIINDKLKLIYARMRIVNNLMVSTARLLKIEIPSDAKIMKPDEPL